MLFPLWEHVPPGNATENRIQGPSPLSLHPNALGKMAELHQGLSTLQSGKITTPISPSIHQHYFGWSKQKQGEPPNTSTGGNGNHPERGGAWTCSSHSALELGSLLSHQEGCVVIFGPLKASSPIVLLILVLS